MEAPHGTTRLDTHFIFIVCFLGLGPIESLHYF